MGIELTQHTPAQGRGTRRHWSGEQGQALAVFEEPHHPALQFQTGLPAAYLPACPACELLCNSTAQLLSRFGLFSCL